MTPQKLADCVDCGILTAARWVDHITRAMSLYCIDTPRRQAAFLAQIGHESGGLHYTSEIWGPTPAQRRYEGRRDLGNTQPGDGSRFRGHGLIQTTGRANHARVRDRLRKRFPELKVPDFEADPLKLTEPQWAAMSAADFWDDKGLTKLADDGKFDAVSQRVNGGQNGRDDRQERFIRCLGVLA